MLVLLGKKSYAVFVLILLVLVLAFGGCGKKKQGVAEKGKYSGEVYLENGLPKDEKVTLKTIFSEQGYGMGYFKYAVETFQERFPNVKIDVQWVEAGGDTAHKIVDSVIKSGNNKDMFDIIFSISSSTYKSLISGNKLEVQDELWERKLYDKVDIKVKDIMLGDEKEIFNADGHIYAVPQSMNIFGLFFNKKLFRENGWNDSPSNWEEFVQLCDRIKSLGVYPMVMAGKYPFYFNFAWNAIPYEIGGEEYRESVYSFDPDIYISKPYIVKLQRMEEFAKKGYFHPGTISFDHIQSQMELVQGNAALIPCGAWIANEMKDVVPHDFEWGFMPFPGNDEGGKQVILASQEGSGCIWRNKPKLNKQWAKEFNLWRLNLDIALEHAKNGGIPVRKDFEADSGVISPSVVAALKAIKDPNIKVVNPGVRSRTISNAEFVKHSKVANEGYINLIMGKKNALQVANEINNQYMKGLKAEKSR